MHREINDLVSSFGFIPLPILKLASEEITEIPEGRATPTSLLLFHDDNALSNVLWNLVSKQGGNGGIIQGGGGTSMTSSPTWVTPPSSIVSHDCNEGVR